MQITVERKCGMVFVSYRAWRIKDQRSLGLLDNYDAFHLRVKGAYVWKIAGVRERMTPRLPRYDRARIK